MNRHLLRALPGALLFLAVLATQAHAGWVTKEIFWNKSSVGTPTNPTGIYVRDTTYNVVAAGQTDTTGTFTLNDAQVWRQGHGGATTTVDTMTVAYLLLQSDSAGVSASTLTSLTYEIDGRVGGFPGATQLGNWRQCDSLLVTFVNTPASSVHAAPIRVINGLGFGSDAENNINFFYRPMAFDNLRIRLTAAAGVLSAARVFIRYWTPG